MEKLNEEPSTVSLLPTVVSQKNSPPPRFDSASMSSIINMLWLYRAAGGQGHVLLTERANAHQQGTSCNALMHLRALTSIKRDNGQLSCASQAKKLECA